MKKEIQSLLVLLAFTNISFSQTVSIPDANFKAYLVGNTDINTNEDSEIQTTEAAAFSGSIICSDLGISDLTGIEAFTALSELDCSTNSLTSLNLSSNPDLTTLFCQENQLTSLNISANPALSFLACFDNQLTSLDVSSNSLLADLYCGDNELTTLDVSSNTFLELLFCYNNELTDLDVEGATALSNLSCFNNQLTELDLTTNEALTYFYGQENELSSLDLFELLNLSSLSCWDNQLASLDLSTNTGLYFVNCSENSLTELNIANGTNTNIASGDFIATDNPDLACIKVDDVAYSNTNWTGDVDPTASFNLSCSVGITETDKDNFKVFPNPVNSILFVEIPRDEVQEIKIANLAGEEVLGALSNTNTIDVSILPKGVYFLQLRTASGISTQRFIKE